MASGYTRERYYSLGEGIYRVTARNDPQFPNGAFWDLENIIYDQDSDNPEAMRGASRLGSTDMGGTVSGLFDYNLGTAIATCTDGKIYNYTGTDWAAESGARATSNDGTITTRWTGNMFYGATTGQQLLVLCNGIDAPAKYNGTDVTNLGGSPPSTGNFPTPWQGKLWMASGTLVHYSANSDCEEWGTGAGNISIYRGYDGNLTGLSAFANNLIFFKRNSIYRMSPNTGFDLPNIRNVSSVIGCVNHNTIREGGDGNTLYFMSNEGPKALVTSASHAGFRVIDMDRWIKPIAINANKDATNVAWAVWNQDRKEYYLHYCEGSASVPNRALIGNAARPRKAIRWTRFSLPDMTAGMQFSEGGTDYQQWIGDAQGRVYHMHQRTEHTFGGRVYRSVIKTPYHTQGIPENMKKYGWAFTDMDVDGPYEVTVNLQMLRSGLPVTEGNKTQVAFIEASDSVWGTGAWGEATWGGSGSQGQRIRPVKVARASGMGMQMNVGRWFRLNGYVIASDLRRDIIAA